MNNNSPTRNSFLRVRYNGGKGGLSEVHSPIDDSTSTYYALPKKFYEKNFKPSHYNYEGSEIKHYSPDPSRYVVGKAIQESCTNGKKRY